MSKDRWIILIASALLFIPFLGSVHLFDWDEINFAESAREMLLTGNWFQVQINFVPFWEKPPLFFWMQALSMKAFGINEFAARLPNAICGIVTLQVMYSLGVRFQNRSFAWLWVLLYAGSFLPFLYFKSGIIDPWFNLFIFLSIYYLYRTIQEDRLEQRNAMLAGAFSGLAVLTKGPVGFLLLLLTFLVWWIFNRFKKPAKWSSILVFGSSLTIVSSVWFAYETFSNGPWFLVEFIAYQIDLFLHPVAGHKQPIYYHFLVVLLGCFPLSVLALPAFSRTFVGDPHHFSRWMKMLFWVVMVLFSIVTTKIVHYSSMAYLPLSYLAVLVVFGYVKRTESVRPWQRIWIGAQGVLLSVALTAVPLLLLYRAHWIGRVSDAFVRGNLTAPYDSLGWEWILGVMYLCIVIGSLWLMRKEVVRSIVLLTLGTSLTIFGTMRLVVPMIESMSQRSAVVFFKSQQGKDVYLDTYGYKSYAHYFYGAIQPSQAHLMDEHALLADDKTVMISVKANRLERFQKEYPKAEYLYDAGGFYFYRLPFQLAD